MNESTHVPQGCLSFQKRHEWRDWLVQNHLENQGAWLVILKKRAKSPGIRYDDAVEEAICFGWIDGKMKGIDDEKFILYFSPRKKDSVWSKINQHRAKKLITEGKMTEAGLEKIEVAKQNGQWDAAYSSKKPQAIPDDLKRALQEDQKAWDNFNRLANSHQTAYVIWMMQAKTGATRGKRIKEVVARASLNKKPGEKID